MPLKKSSGNMYPWVTHTHCHLGGECLHKCKYCYVDNPRFGRPAKYTGEIRLIEVEFSVRYGEGKTIFVECMNDLFAAAVPWEHINRILTHCAVWPKNFVRLPLCRFIMMYSNYGLIAQRQKQKN